MLALSLKNGFGFSAVPKFRDKCVLKISSFQGHFYKRCSRFNIFEWEVFLDVVDLLKNLLSAIGRSDYQELDRGLVYHHHTRDCNM